ncbi:MULTISPECIES: hypothetical protein [Neorhizobium]|jgi:hypothetical protein|uniref:hypothetical protein n=1 Tax=Neorhizobium TaxID=1525371 RepID=UPI000CF950E5|nr:hypothetical protein [Neorhizobium sp. T7_12]
MSNIDDELRVLHSAVRSLEKKWRRTGDEYYPNQIRQLKEMIADRERGGLFGLEKSMGPPRGALNPSDV